MTTKPIAYPEPSERGQDLFYGLGVRKNYRKAFPLLMEAAQSGHVHCMNLVGYSYDSGFGVQKDFAAAVHWYGRAAEHSHRVALYNLAVCYDRGHGVQADPDKAFSLYQQSAMLGDLPQPVT